jgi:hypothetical protein
MKTIIKTLIYLTVFTELFLSSCGTTKNLYGEYDDLYYLEKPFALTIIGRSKLTIPGWS